MNSAQDTPQVSLGGWVAPFGDPGITDRSHLPRAFRSVPRPSSPLSAKASTRCPCFALDHRIAVTGDAAPPPRTGPNPVPGPGEKRGRRPRMKTLLSDQLGASTASPGPSASVTSQLSLHPSINSAPIARRGVVKSSPNVAFAMPRAPALPAPCRQAGRRPFSLARATPGARQTAGLPVVPLGAVPLHPSAGKALLAGGGGERIRTDDLLLAKQALSQLSYTPRQGSADPDRRSEILMPDA